MGQGVTRIPSLRKKEPKNSPEVSKCYLNGKKKKISICPKTQNVGFLRIGSVSVSLPYKNLTDRKGSLTLKTFVPDPFRTNSKHWGLRPYHGL